MMGRRAVSCLVQRRWTSVQPQPEPRKKEPQKQEKIGLLSEDTHKTLFGTAFRPSLPSHVPSLTSLPVEWNGGMRWRGLRWRTKKGVARGRRRNWSRGVGRTSGISSKRRRVGTASRIGSCCKASRGSSPRRCRVSGVRRRGWSAYDERGTARSVLYPSGSALVLDVEVAESAGVAPVLAVALTERGWFSWVGGSLSGEEWLERRQLRLEDLIPLGPPEGGASIVVGHNVSFDRSFVGDAYSLADDGRRWWDTMSLHIALHGLASHQQTHLAALAKRDPASLSPKEAAFLNSRSLNNLADVHKTHCKRSQITISKDLRNAFIRDDLPTIRSQFQVRVSVPSILSTRVQAQFQDLMTYCGKDVLASFEIHQSLWPQFQKT